MQLGYTYYIDQNLIWIILFILGVAEHGGPLQPARWVWQQPHHPDQLHQGQHQEQLRGHRQRQLRCLRYDWAGEREGKAILKVLGSGAEQLGSGSKLYFVKFAIPLFLVMKTRIRFLNYTFIRIYC